MNVQKIGVACALTLILRAAPALADTSVGGGEFWAQDGSTNIGLLGSRTIMGLPGVPVKVQVSLAVPFGAGGRFALTGEGTYKYRQFFAGAGGGFGKVDATRTRGLMYDYFGGYRIAPLTSIQGRYYGNFIGNTGSATYLGVAFGLK